MEEQQIPTVQRDPDHEEHPSVASRNQLASNPINQNDREEREVNNKAIPSPILLQTVRSTGLVPFTTTIVEAPMLEKPPAMLDKYDGSTDPDDHLRTYAMAFYSSNDLVMCKAFSLSLKREALAWYNTLPLNTVDCFATVEFFSEDNMLLVE
ncbi:hypothetical protein LR48_Vigan03g096000 [Vigna angularis]|uniref:Retrotransposon gag domain-containing protein n=1 Tax=Phaseolus angularis TaxID=3914 RepID=A0A0L9U428_PHAAN|nr:hypothetical protein LR48_Vigan03g096000 [Vigna angularis]